MRSTKQKWNFELGAQLAVVFMLIVVSLISVMTVVVYQFFFNRTQETLQSSVKAAISTKMESLKVVIGQIDMVTTFLCDDSQLYIDQNTMPDLYLMLQNYEKSGRLADVMGDYNRIGNTMSKYFNFLSAYNANYSFALYIDSQWSLTQRLRSMGSSQISDNLRGIFSGIGVEKEQWYQSSIAANGQPYWFVCSEAQDRLNMAKLLYCKVLEENSIQIRVLGVLCLSFDISWLSDELSQDLDMGIPCIIIRDKGNRILYTSRDLPESIELPQSQSDFPASDLNAGNGDWLMDVLSLSDELSAVIVTPTKYPTDLNTHNFRQILILGVITILIGCMLVIFCSKMITRPIKTLALHMEHGSLKPLQKGRDRRDEVGMLYRGYNSLVIRIDQLVINIAQEVETKKRANLRALQAQINPHFVYNTLDTICCLLMLEGKDSIADILVALSQIMRYNTKKPDELVPLSRELDMLQKYYLIQKACYEDAISFECDAQADTLNYLVPKQIIQPLVENAILHGMGASGKGEIDVKIRILHQILTIDVRDNGTQADINAINQLIHDPKSADCSESIGIKNINERLQYVYGIESGLTFLRDENGCTVARIQICHPTMSEIHMFEN